MVQHQVESDWSLHIAYDELELQSTTESITQQRVNFLFFWYHAYYSIILHVFADDIRQSFGSQTI